MAAVIGTLRAELAAKIAGFVSDMDKAADSVGKFQKRFQSYGKRLQKAGLVMSAAVTTPLTALAVKSFKAFEDSEDAVASVEQVLKSMGKGAGFTTEQLQEMAAQLQKVSTFDDDEILTKVTANLLTFGDVAGDIFKRAQVVALDLSTRLKQDLQTSIIQVGKALNDPIKGIKALTRVGVQFTDEQKDQIEALVDAGKKAEAQQIILSELEREFGGQAAAAAKTTRGQLSVLGNAWGDVMEKIGGILNKALPPIVENLNKFLDYVDKLSEPTLQWGVALGLAAASAGALAWGLGSIIKSVGQFIEFGNWLIGSGPKIAGAIVAMTGPFGLFLAAMAGVVLLFNENQDAIKAWAKNVEAAISQWADAAGAKIDAGIAKIKEAFAAFLEYMRNFAAELIKIVTDMASQVAATITEKLTAAFDAVKAKIDQVKGWFRDMYDAVVGHSYVPDMVDGIATQFGRLDDIMVSKAKESSEAVQDAFKQLGGIIGNLLHKLVSDGKVELKDLADAAAQLAQTLFIQPFTSALGKQGGFGGFLSELFGNFAGGFAQGGVIQAGSWGIVGERGREAVFAGNQDLTVVPNGGMGGAVTQNFFITTPDADSFRLSERQIRETARRRFG